MRLSFRRHKAVWAVSPEELTAHLHGCSVGFSPRILKIGFRPPRLAGLVTLKAFAACCLRSCVLYYGIPGTRRQVLSDNLTRELRWNFVIRHHIPSLLRNHVDFRPPWNESECQHIATHKNQRGKSAHTVRRECMIIF